ncbi:MAG: GNAT family N-acetyltransferase [Firmicutes bacterium]|jgi:ribosomal protein S18 acetylase RimI-like enzyme|nr:GNAT family N-acetyltransferase [Bacillota bacterium]MDD4336588.1 GNAT family N-acetyltransferase [Bacillota bacterium]MDD4792644.1 GNAT family N-acetyltransferase [Bacillota bacterium]
MIHYTDSISNISAQQLSGFFVGWRRSVSPSEHLEILRGSDHVVLALDDCTNQAVGFITVITDGVIAAYMPLLEVLPEYQGRGIGTELVRRALDKLQKMHMIDVICDPDVQAFYARLGMVPWTGMIIRR